LGRASRFNPKGEENMAFDLSSVSPAARERATRVGAGFGTDQVTEQTEITLGASARRAAVLAKNGFRASHHARLTDLQALHTEARVARENARAGRKTTNTNLQDAMKNGKSARGRARTNLESARGDLEMTGTPEAMALVNKIDGVLAVTSTAGADPEALRDQLMQLHGVFDDPKVQELLEGEAASVQTELSTCATALEVASASHAYPPGTSAETDHLNFIEGLIVDLLRLARRAARSAARALGQPALAEEFELRALYRSGSSTPKQPSSGV